ncbi:MAG: PetM family cytochrome b6-f complex subunit 7 [Cyanophyceae cyanobacterium]
MSAHDMLFNGAILSFALILVGLAWGFLLLKIQGGEESEL